MNKNKEKQRINKLPKIKFLKKRREKNKKERDV